MFTRDDWDGHWIASDDEDLTTIVWDGVTPVVSTLEVARRGDYYRRNEEPFLTIINPNDFRLTFGGGGANAGMSGQVRHKHPWALDDEGDGAMTAYLQFVDVSIVSAFASTTTYMAWLLEMPQFWPKGFADNPFIGAKRKKDNRKNSGYPYTPPQIIGGKQGLTVPMRIELEFRVNTPNGMYGDLTEWYGKKWEEYIK